MLDGALPGVSLDGQQAGLKADPQGTVRISERCAWWLARRLAMAAPSGVVRGHDGVQDVAKCVEQRHLKHGEAWSLRVIGLCLGGLAFRDRQGCP